MGSLFRRSKEVGMAVEIPTLVSYGLISLSACGDFRTRSKLLRNWAKENEKEYLFGVLKDSSGSNVFARVSIDNLKDHIHVHVDLATDSYFGDGDKPKATPSFKFEDFFTPLMGQKLEVDVWGDFVVSQKDLPESILIMQKVSETKDSIRVRMVGGTLAVEGAPINTISWRFKDETGDAIVRMKGSGLFEFSTSYFKDCRTFLTSFAESFLERSGSNEE